MSELKYEELLRAFEEKILVLKATGYDVTELLTQLEVFKGYSFAENNSIKKRIFYDKKSKELAILINRIDNMLKGETHNETIETDMEFNELFNNPTMLGVSCITDSAVITKVKANGDKYHHEILGDILTELTVNEKLRTIESFNNCEYKNYCMFIRYVVYEDSIEITIDLPYTMTNGMIEGFVKLVDEWKKVSIGDDKLVQIYICDEEYCTKNPNIDGLEVCEMDQFIEYLKSIEIDNKSK